MPTANVIDLSHWNIVESLIPTAGAGTIGVIHKATEGMGAIDGKCGARRYLADEAGLAWGLYHFLRPGDVSDQADHFLATAAAADVLDDDTLLACDYEIEGIELDEVLKFLEHLEEATGRAPVLYSGHVLKEALGGQAAGSELTRYRLWLAQYAEAPELPPGYDGYWAWQFTDQGSTPGISPPVDLNQCLDPIGLLKARAQKRKP